MNTRKKVLLCVTKSGAGGAQKYVYDIATRLPSDTFEAVVVAGGSGPLFDMLTRKGIRTIAIPGLERDINSLRELQAFFHLIRIFIQEKPDIIHLNSSKMGAMGAVAAYVSKILTLNFKPSVIFTVHGWGFREDRSTWQQMAIFGVSWIASLFHNHTIVINSADHRDALAFIPHKCISLVPLGIEMPDALSREQSRAFFSSRTGCAFDDKTIIIGATAELTKNKGLSYLVDALHDVLRSQEKTNVHCIIMGEGEERTKMEEQIKKLDLENHISLAGFVPNAYRYLSGLDLFALSSVKEGLPYALMEAMAAGLPVIATHVGGIPDLITHDTNGILIPAKNSHALKTHFQHLLASQEKRDILGMQAKETIARNFGLERMIGNTLKCYHELTQPHQ